MKNDEQYKSKLSHIRQILDASSGEDWAFVPEPVITIENLRYWELQHTVALPDQFRLFLTEIGNGGVMPGDYCDFVLLSLDLVQGASTAASPFPISNARLRERYDVIKAERRPDDGILFPELQRIWEADCQPEGCLVIGHYPSFDSLFLITAGDLQGSLWCGAGFGTPEQRDGEFLGFLDWFAEILQEFEGGA